VLPPATKPTVNAAAVLMCGSYGHNTVTTAVVSDADTKMADTAATMMGIKGTTEAETVAVFKETNSIAAERANIATTTAIS
jgi:hypothetical protein